MQDVCHHCGAALPRHHDAFCPECRGELAEPPALPLGYARGGTASTDEPGRPGGVTFVAVMHLLGGVGGALVLFNLVRRLGGVGMFDPFDARGVLGAAGIGVLIALSLAAGAGLLLGRAWGWWLAAGYYVYSVIHSVWSAALFQQLPDPLLDSSRSEFYFTRYAIRATIHAIVLLYLFQPHVRGYFGLDGLRKGLALAVLFLVGATVVVGAALVGAALEG